MSLASRLAGIPRRLAYTLLSMRRWSVERDRCRAEFRLQAIYEDGPAFAFPTTRRLPTEAACQYVAAE